MSEPVVVQLHGFAHGGEAVGRLPDGRAVFVAYGIPGETVTIDITAEHKRWARGRLREVTTASPDRVDPPCPYFGPDRCGGCRLQHIAPERRHVLLRQVVIDQLQRLGRIADPPVAEVVPAGEYRYRSRARFAVTPAGELGYRRSASNDVLPIDDCLLLDEPTAALRAAAGDDFSGLAEVEVRTATAGAAVVGAPGRAPVVLRGDEALTHDVGGFSYVASPASFFQANPTGAALLLDLVREAAAVAPGESALDLYAGVGLFARGLAADGASVTAVEGSRSSARDARTNLAGHGRVVAKPVERVIGRMAGGGEQFDVVVLDPPRRGAGAAVVQGVAAVARRVIVYVACDAAALGRDAGTLSDLGWHLTAAVPVDQFAQTGHIEIVATFVRADTT